MSDNNDDDDDDGGDDGGLVFRPERSAITEPRATPWVLVNNRNVRPEGAKAFAGRPCYASHLPRALPWTGSFMACQAVCFVGLAKPTSLHFI